MKQLAQLVLFLFIKTVISQETAYEVLNTSINSKYADLGVTYLNNNTVLFASSKKSENDKSFKKDRRKNNQQLYLEFYEAIITRSGDLIQTNKFSKEINNMFFESDIAFTPDLSTVYFTWNNFYTTHESINSDEWKTLHIVKASIDKNFEVSNIIPLPFNSEKYSIKNPQVSYNGKQLFFVSDMPGGYGKTDIYVVDINSDGPYSEPKNLGATINTYQAELYPFVDQQHTLYFSSDGHKGLGKLDIFKSDFNNGNYQKVKNLPPPINSKFDDFALVTNNVANSGYFTSTRKKNKRDADIYAFKTTTTEIVQCTKSITGLTLNKETQKPIDNVLISLYHNNILQETITGNAFDFNLNCNENYKIIAQKEGFASAEITLETDNTTNSPIFKTVLLSPLECNELFAGVVLDKETNKPLSKAFVKIYKNSDLLKTLKTATNGTFNYDTECDSQYIIIASYKNYKENVFAINSSTISNKISNHKILLTPEVEFITVRKQKSIKINPILFDLNSSYLRPASEIELNKVVKIMKKYPNLVIKSTSHTDSRESHKYNLWLSERRALRTVNYIVSKGISPNRISGKGFGESQLVNKCSNNVKCSEAEHQENRRTEFIVIKE